MVIEISQRWRLTVTQYLRSGCTRSSPAVHSAISIAFGAFGSVSTVRRIKSGKTDAIPLFHDRNVGADANVEDGGEIQFMHFKDAALRDQNKSQAHP